MHLLTFAILPILMNLSPPVPVPPAPIPPLCAPSAPPSHPVLAPPSPAPPLMLRLSA